MSQKTQGSYQADVTVRQILKPSAIGRRQLLVCWLQLADQNTYGETYYEKAYLVFIRILKRRPVSWLIARNSQTQPPELSAQMSTIEQEDK